MSDDAKSTIDLIKEIKPTSVISNLLNALPNDALLRSFSQVYLESIPDRILSRYTVDDLVGFLKKRYNFFTSHINDPQVYFTLDRFEEFHSAGDRFVLELTSPDAYFLLITLELILQQHNAQITRMYHPILKIKRENGNVVEISKPEVNSEMRSSIYLEFDITSLDDDQITALKAEISQKMDAVQLSHQDHHKMIDLLMDVKSLMHIHPSPIQQFHAEWIDLMDWLKEYNYSFFGYCKFNITGNNKKTVRLDQSKSLGILQNSFSHANADLLVALKKQTQRLVNYRSPFIFDIIAYKSPIQRFENLMRLSIKIPISDTQIEEHNFIGLLKRSSLLVKNQETPIIRLKMNMIIDNKHLLPGSYDYNQVIRIFTHMPKFELFRTPAELLYQMVDNLLSITNPNEVHCFTRREIEPNRSFIMVVIPLSLHTPDNIALISTVLTDQIPHDSYEMIPVKGAQLGWVSFIFDQPNNPHYEIDVTHFENEIKTKIQPWDALLVNSLQAHFSAEESHVLYRKYFLMFPPHHRVRRTPHETVRDIVFLEQLFATNKMQFNLVPFIFPDSVLHNKASMIFIYNLNKIDLIHVMPILQNLGLHVFDELTTRIGTRDNTMAYIHSFRVANQDEAYTKVDEDKLSRLLVDLLQAVFNRQISNDPLNALVTKCFISWREVNIIKTYRAYMLQIDKSVSREKINHTLLKHTSVCALLVRYFNARFNPEISQTVSQRLAGELANLNSQIVDYIHGISDITEDIVLSRLFALLTNTLRTNYFIPKQSDVFISLKFDTQSIKLPSPVPYREIFVYDAQMEGTHIRFGPISRGGLRWSDRRDDFRREILDLVKTQQTKNVVIIPAGSKGGFVIKRPESDDMAVEGKRQYQKFIKGLLDITDNLNNKGDYIHSDYVVRYDDPDPYLVVAADKGTATFSDYANEVSQDYQFWLGDAFASGGQYGYSHKDVGITAKGAWECVRLHFKELNIDVQKDPVTVMGIGDMSGDVFGNGMLLSQSIKLQAAFNHLHIFLDPNPNPTVSWKERSRLFNMPRSLWTDYNSTLISKGGGVFDRYAKTITLTPEMQSMLNTTESVLNGDQLVQLILKMNVDLLWFGGIGTYIKSDTETHYDVGDPANEGIRIDFSECNARVIGEGANLGITQKARIQLSQKKGVRLNSDFIDNSAGVNMSDYEVNLKILLTQLMAEKKVKRQDHRNQLLKQVTDMVTGLCIANNQSNHYLLSIDTLRSEQTGPLFIKLITEMIAQKRLNPVDECIPDIAELEELATYNKPFPRPLLATVQAYVKMNVYEALIQSEIMASQDLSYIYQPYFPPDLYNISEKIVNLHRLRSEIITTLTVNMIVNEAGATFFYKMTQLTTKPIDQIALSYLIVNRLLGISDLKTQLLNATIDCDSQYRTILNIDQTVESVVLDLLDLPNLTLSLALLPKLVAIKTTVDSVKRPIKTDDVMALVDRLPYYADVCSLFYLSENKGCDVANAHQLLTILDDILCFHTVTTQLRGLELVNPTDITGREILFQLIKLLKRNLAQTLFIKFKSQSDQSIDAMRAYLLDQYPTQVGKYLTALEDIQAHASQDISHYTIALNQLSMIAFVAS